MESATEELIPDPSALIIPGYNLPGHLFNDGKPFYVEKDPLTGAINFTNKTPAGKEYNSNEYDYIDEEANPDMFDKSNIDRKDGGYASHRPNDVNQLTPNFHDFLNLPVKYSNPEKYVYPLISSSYANTKIQGHNVNSFNHKQYAAATYKPTVSPTYYATKPSYNNINKESDEKYFGIHTTAKPHPVTPTTNTRVTTEAPTKPTENLLNIEMNHPSYYVTTPEYDYDYYTTQNSIIDQHENTEEPPRNEVYLKPSSTKKPYSIFDELFGDYEEQHEVYNDKHNTQNNEPPSPPTMFGNLGLNVFDNKQKENNKIVQITPSVQTRPTTVKPITTTASTTTIKPIKTTPQTTKQPQQQNHYSNYDTVSSVYPEEENGMYEYEDDYSNNYHEETMHVLDRKELVKNSTSEVSTQKSVVMNVRNETNPRTTTSSTTTTEKTQFFSNSHQFNYKQPVVITTSTTSTTQKPKYSAKTTTSRYSDRFSTLPSITTEKPDSNFISITSEKYDYYNGDYKTIRPRIEVTTKVTSMPLGENHFSPNVPRRPLITLTENMKDTLSREKVETTTKIYPKLVPPPPAQTPVPVPHYDKNYQKNPNTQQTVLHHAHVPSTSNIRIAPDQDIVSFVVGNHQNVDGGHYIGSALKEETYHSNSFRPLYNQQSSVVPVFDQVVYNQPMKATLNYGPSSMQVQNNDNSFQEGSSASINVQPIMGSQASLSIGIPAEDIKKVKVKGEVVDEKLDLNENVEYPKEPGTKIVFPEEDYTTYTPPPRKQLVPNMPNVFNLPNHPNLPNKEILSLYSKPMFHQLPADLTPPSEPEVKPPPPSVRPGNPRPPWDPRPGHFYQGRPEYARPPRPHKPEVYKRIDGLPNILPQFRPNAKVSNGHYIDNVGTINAGYMPRQPLLDRPSNRPIGFFEKLHPPPPPKRMHDLRKVTALENDQGKHDRYRYEERILNVPNIKPQEHFGGYQLPPKIPVANRKSEDESEIATLQMIQAKQSDKLDTIKPNVPPPFKITYQQEATEKPLYVVYPVNSAPLKLDVLDTDKRETVVVGTRGEQLPLPPSKISPEPVFEQKPLLKPKDRNDSPILKPHSRPNNYPIKSDFPYMLERPDPTLINIPISSSTSDINPSGPSVLDTTVPTVSYNKLDFSSSNYQSNNQWTSLDTESRIVNGNNKMNYVNSDQISATLKTYTEKPIAIAYTPTEPNNDYVGTDKFSVPNFGRPVISEIRPEGNNINNNKVNQYGTVSNDDSEFTVSAVMHTHPQIKLKHQNEIKYFNPDQKTLAPFMVSSTRRTHLQDNLENHKLNLDVDSTHIPAKLDFQAPFHASVSIDSEYQGWSVVNQNAKSEIDRSDTDVTTNQPESASEFDIENFKPQLFGGFKPLYSVSNEKEKVPTTAESERQE